MDRVDVLSKAVAKALSERSKYGNDDIGALEGVSKNLPEIKQAIAKIKLEKDNKKVVNTDLFWAEKLDGEAKVMLKNPQQIVADAEIHRKETEVKAIEENIKKIRSELDSVDKLLKKLPDDTLHPTAKNEAETAQNISVRVRGALEGFEEYKKVSVKLSISEQSGHWLQASGEWLKAVAEASKAAQGAESKHETGVKSEIQTLAAEAEKALEEANAAREAIPKRDADARRKIEEKLKPVNEAMKGYRAAFKDNTLVSRADHWRSDLKMVMNTANSEKVAALSKHKDYQATSKAKLDDERARNAARLKDAFERIEALKLRSRNFPKNAEAEIWAAALEYGRAKDLMEERDDELRKKDWLEKLDALSEKGAKVEGFIRQVNQHADEAERLYAEHEKWLRFLRWSGGALALCLFATGGYLLYRGWRRHMHLKGENLLLGRFTEEQGIIRIEAGPEGEIRTLTAPDAFKKQLGYTPVELAALKLANLLAPSSRADLNAALVGMEADGKVVRPKRIQCHLQTKAGGTVQVEGVFLAQRNGVQGTTVALLEDVSWRDELADAQARIAALSVHGKEGLLLLDERQRIVVVNPAFCQWFGLTKPAGELRGLPVEQLGPNFTPLLKDPSVITGSENVSKSIQVGGVSLQAEATSITAASRQAGRAIFFRDVTAEVQADEKLRPLMERFRTSTPENFRIGMAVIAPDGSVLAASQSMCDFFGYSREELLAQNEQKLRTSGNGAEAAKGSVSQAAVRRSYRRKDGSVVTARVQMTECRDERGALLYSTMSIDDRGANPAPPKPAVWMSKDATDAWCPAIIAPHLPWASAGFKYEDNYAEQADAGIPGWHLSGATRRGRLHAQHGTHREDAFRWETGETFTIACVSDGAGSSKFSRVGSESICRDVTRLIRKALDESKAKLVSSDSTELTNIVGRAMQEGVRQASTSLHELAVKAPCEIKDFRCTMLLVVHYQHASGAVLLGSQVGDGFIQGLMQDGTTQRFGTPDSGKFSGEVSCFLPEVNAVEKAYKIFRIPHEKLQTLLLCTDGIEDAFFPIEKAAEGLFRQLNNGVQQKLDEFDAQKVHGPILGTLTDLVALQAWLDFEKRGENDDRTVLVLHRQQSVSTPPVIAPG
jgi:PAS domain S-box-containing protein